jgi:RNA polymerase primary sigma factor
MKHQLESTKCGRQNIVAVERTTELARYLAVVNNFKPLSIDEEVELASLIKKGDKAAKDKLVNANLGFVVSVAKQYDYCKGTLTLLDLINEGNIGLIEAAETFDATYGFKFISYAVNYIKAHILDALTHNSRLVADYHKGAPNSHSSLDAPMADDNDTTLGDIICTSTDAESFVGESLTTDILRALNSVLKAKEVTIICVMYGIGTPSLSKWQIAEKLGVTDERVRQMAQMAIGKLRNNEQAMTLLSKYL